MKGSLRMADKLVSKSGRMVTDSSQAVVVHDIKR